MEEALEAKEEWTPAEDFDTGLTADDWKEILEDNDFIKKHPAGSIALWLYYKYDTPCSYTGLAQKYGIYDGYYKGGMGIFNEQLAVSSKFKISLKIKEKIRPFTDKKGKEVYWYLSFMARKPEKGEVGTSIFKLRDEVCEGFDKLSEERRQMFEEMFQHKKKEYEMNPKPKIWVISAGNNGKEWANFISEPAKMAIGWNDLGDLTEKTAKEIEQTFLEFYDDKNHKSLSSIKKFVTAKEGDFIFARAGQKLLGFGCVVGKYRYDSDIEYRHTFPVEWIRTDLESDLIKSYQGEVFTELKKKDLENQEIKEIMQEYIGNQYTESADNTSKSADKKVENTSSEKQDKTPLELIEESSLTPKEKEWGRMLVNSHQIILTGAPGTGKTFVAQKIANVLTENKAGNIEFVQFHPSMDYTDFVEGLRPRSDENNQNENAQNENNQISFERQDGIFKAFCKKALENWKTAQKTEEVQKEEKSLNEDFDEFLDENIPDEDEEDDDKFIFKLTQTKAPFRIIGRTDKNLLVKKTSDSGRGFLIPYTRLLEAYSNFSNIIENMKKPKEIRNFLYGDQNRFEPSYMLPIIKKFNEFRKNKKKKNSTEFQKEKQKNFVFIIDEINRGDIAKIFGELFYAIDPSYRWKKGDSNENKIPVKTQYQSLLKGTLDLYANGFYIPENVYIIGTMNDIDRGVESMDFAIRRRFTWIEVKPKDTQSMLDSLTDSQTVKDKMNALNDVISEKIGPAYQIGGAYFLKLKELKELKDNGGLEDGQDEFDALWKYHLKPLLEEYLRGEPKNEIKEKIGEMKDAYDNPPKKGDTSTNSETTKDDASDGTDNA